MIEIKLKIDNINYDEAVDVLFPLISDKLEERLLNSNKVAGIFGTVMNRNRNFNMELVKNILHGMPDEKKEELILLCIEGREESIASMVQEMIYERGLSLCINELELKKQ